MTGMLSLLIFAGLFVIVAIDRPFAGSVKVQPEALHFVLDEFGEPKHPYDAWFPLSLRAPRIRMT